MSDYKMYIEAIKNIYIINIVVYSFFSISFLNFLNDIFSKFNFPILSLYIYGFFLKFTISIISNSIILEKLNKTCLTGYDSKIIFIKSATLSIFISGLDLLWFLIYIIIYKLKIIDFLSYKYFILLDFIIINLLTFLAIKYTDDYEINNNYICEKVGDEKIGVIITFFIIFYVIFLFFILFKFNYNENNFKENTKINILIDSLFNNDNINISKNIYNNCQKEIDINKNKYENSIDINKTAEMITRNFSLQ